MAKVSVVLLADTETHGDMGRVANALTTVKECSEAGDQVELVFDGAATKWIPELDGTDHKLAPLFGQIRQHVAGACEFCAGAFGVRDEVKASGVPFLSEYQGHPSLRQRVEEGYEVITF